MANLYVRSTDGSDSDNGSTWALAKASLSGAAAADAAGDVIYVSQAHAESTAAAQTFNFAGVLSNPVYVYGANDANQPPTASATGGSVTTTGANNIVFAGSCYVDNLSFVSGQAINWGNGSAAVQHFKNCKFRTNNGGSAGSFTVTGNNVPTKITLENCTYYFSHANNRFTLQHSVWMRGGGFESGTTTPTTLFILGADGRGGDVLVENVDFSNLSSSFSFVNGGSSLAASTLTLKNCKLPASWSGSLVSGTFTGFGTRASMYNCDSADTNYRMWVEDYAGSIKTETTLVKTGGASDGTTPISWKMVASGNARRQATPLVSDEILVWNETTGSALTLTIDILRDSSSDLANNDLWMEAYTLSTSGAPLGTITSSAPPDFLTASSTYASSSATWTTTGMSNPNKQKMTVTVTPQEKGWIAIRIFFALATATVYIDPVVQVS